MLSNTIRFLQIADWGGQTNEPFFTIPQNATAVAMSEKAKEINAQFVIALGDNFYTYGITDTCLDPRFEETWVDIYYQESLSTIPWYVNAGNHDHRGNVTSQIEYSNINKYWIFPSLYHKHTFYSDDGSVSLDIILIDTSTYTGLTEPHYPSTSINDLDQQVWIEEALSESTADYIIVGGHFPVYSVCKHGTETVMIDYLKPLLDKYEAHYMCGHDHCAEHIVVDNTNYWLNGIGRECCYEDTNIDTVPEESLLYLLADTQSSGTGDINGTISGYSTIVVSSTNLTVSYYNQNNDLLYTSSVNPRSQSASDSNDNISIKQILVLVGIAIVSLFVVSMLYLCSRNYYKKSYVVVQQDDKQLLSNIITDEPFSHN